jgi:hypothetical protein
MAVNGGQVAVNLTSVNKQLSSTGQFEGGKRVRQYEYTL